MELLQKRILEFYYFELKFQLYLGVMGSIYHNLIISLLKQPV